MSFNDIWRTFIERQYKFYFGEQIKISPKEEYYNNKYPKKNVVYKRTDQGKTINIDVRQFIQPNNFQLPTISGKDDDQIAQKSLIWVVQNLKYVTDSKNDSLGEYWAFPYQTLSRKTGDCEDGALLLASILIKNGIPNWKIRVTAGWVTNPYTKAKGGHAYVNYYSEKEDKWVVLDWCYLPNLKPLSERESYKDNDMYGNVWFSFNQEYSWTEGLNKDSKQLLNN